MTNNDNMFLTILQSYKKKFKNSLKKNSLVEKF